MMKTAIIEPIGGHGGMDYYDYGLAYGLGENNVEVWIYTSNKTEKRGFKNVHTVLEFNNIWNVNLFSKVYKYLKYHFSSFEKCQKKNINIIHLHFFTFRVIDYLILLKAKQTGLTTVVTIHDINAFDKKANSFMERMCYKLIDGVIVHNKSSFKALLQKKVLKREYAIIPHGNYLPFINPLPEQKNNVFTILFFGQIKKVKGLDILLMAIKKIKNQGRTLKLVIAGKPWKSDLDYYKTLINNLKIKNEVKTDFRYIPNEEVASFYASADLVVLPYTEIYQSGIMLLTMSYGKPLLCSDLLAFKELVEDHKTGFLFQNGNSEDLANKIIYIMDNPNLLKNVTEKANEMIKLKYDWINIGRQTKEFYKQLQ